MLSGHQPSLISNGNSVCSRPNPFPYVASPSTAFFLSGANIFSLPPGVRNIPSVQQFRFDRHLASYIEHDGAEAATLQKQVSALKRLFHARPRLLPCRIKRRLSRRLIRWREAFFSILFSSSLWLRASRSNGFWLHKAIDRVRQSSNLTPRMCTEASTMQSLLDGGGDEMLLWQSKLMCTALILLHHTTTHPEKSCQVHTTGCSRYGIEIVADIDPGTDFIGLCEASNEGERNSGSTR
jgi:hypothetical protein